MTSEGQLAELMLIAVLMARGPENHLTPCCIDEIPLYLLASFHPAKTWVHAHSRL